MYLVRDRRNSNGVVVGNLLNGHFRYWQWNCRLLLNCVLGKSVVMMGGGCN